MRKVILFIAMSLDGYIADQNGGVDWLQGQDSNQETKDIYTEFIQNIDTVIMGWNTYYPVSYTHLDVYKRQIFNNVFINKINEINHRILLNLDF